MSKWPQQLYINEKYLDYSPSVNNNLRYDNKQKHGNKTSRNKTKYEKSYKQSSHSNVEPVKQYMKRHKESIGDYYSLQRNQTDIVNLCRQRIQYLSSNILQNLKDDDIIQALKIAQGRQSKRKHENESMDQFVDTILQAIISNGISKSESQKYRKIDRNKSHELICYSSDDECNKFKNKSPSMLSKWLCAFGKQDLAKYPKFSDYIKSKRNYDSDVKARRYINNSDVTIGYLENKNNKIKGASTSQEFSEFSGSNCTVLRTYSNKCLDKDCSCSKRLKKIEAHLKSQHSKITQIKRNLDEYLSMLKQLDRREEVLKSLMYSNSNFGLKQKYLHTYPVFDKSGNVNGFRGDTTDYRLRAGTHVEETDSTEDSSPTVKPQLKESEYSAERNIGCCRCRRKKLGVKNGKDKDKDKKSRAKGRSRCGARDKPDQKVDQKKDVKKPRHEEWQEPIRKIESELVPEIINAVEDIPSHPSDTPTTDKHEPSIIYVTTDRGDYRHPQRDKQTKSSKSRKKTREEKRSEKRQRKIDNKAMKLQRKRDSKEAAKQAKLDAKLNKKEAKKQRRQMKAEADAKRPCCIRLIKLICCSQCCV